MLLIDSIKKQNTRRDVNMDKYTFVLIYLTVCMSVLACTCVFVIFMYVVALVHVGVCENQFLSRHFPSVVSFLYLLRQYLSLNQNLIV